MPYPLPLTRTEAYLAYKAGVIQQSDLKPSLVVPRNGIDAWLAYWTGLAEDYPKREDGTPHILQEEEAYIAYLCGVLDEYPEKCLRRVGAYLRYLISARWGRPDHPLNREELYLSLIKTQFIPSGDPSSDIEIDGTAKAAFVDVKMYGDTFQQSYTGKNLLKFVTSTAGLNGLTVNYNEASGIVRVSGTPTQNWSNIDSTTKIMSLKAGSYILSVDNPSPLYRLNFRIYDPTASGGYLDLHGGEGGNYIKFTLDHDINDVVMRVYIDHNYDMTAVDWSFKIMLESGSDITLPYEPYVGGIASPNPDYPQTVQTVTGEQVVEVQGKNLFDKNHPNDSKCYVNASGVLASGGNQNLSVYIKCEPNTTYTVSKSNKGTNNRFCVFNTEAEPAIGVSVISTVGTRVGEDNSSSYTITTGANARYLGVFYRAAATTPSESEIKDTIQIEKGSTATNYEPYSSNDYEINLGKNLFNKNDVVNGIPSSTDGSITSTPSIGRTSDYIPVMSDTDYSHTGHPLGWATVAWYKADKSFIRRDANITTITSPSEASYARVSCALGDLGSCQFEAGEPTSYAPYFEPIELCKIGTYQDYIWKDQDKWKIHKETFKHQFDGLGDRWNYGSITHALQDQNFSVSQTGAVKFDVPGVALSRDFTYFPNPGGITSVLPNGCFGFQTTGSYYATFRNDAAFTTKENAIAWIRANKPTLYWALATPTDTVITNQALIDQLEALVKGGSDEGTTYIKVSATDPNLPGLLYVEAAEYI